MKDPGVREAQTAPPRSRLSARMTAQGALPGAASGDQGSGEAIVIHVEGLRFLRVTRSSF